MIIISANSREAVTIHPNELAIKLYSFNKLKKEDRVKKESIRFISVNRLETGIASLTIVLHENQEIPKSFQKLTFFGRGIPNAGQYFPHELISSPYLEIFRLEKADANKFILDLFYIEHKIQQLLEIKETNQE